MTPDADIQREIRQYLLGSLSQGALRRVEERLLAEEDFLEELTLAEEELMDDYVAGRLSADERTEFERHFLSTDERRRQLRFAQTLSRYASAHAEKAAGTAGARRPAPMIRPAWGERFRAFWAGPQWALRFGLALGAVALIACALWLARPSAPPPPRTFVALTLTAGAGDRAEGGASARVALPLRADALRVTLTLPAGVPPAAKYRAELLGKEGRPETFEAAGQGGHSVSVVIPEARLARGQYALRLLAVEENGTERRVGSYLFDVE